MLSVFLKEHVDHIFYCVISITFCLCVLLTLRRRGGISYERADKNAIYVRALGDGKMKGKAGLGDSTQLLEWERKLLDKMTLPENKLRIRSRFMSLHRVHRRRRPAMKLSYKNKQELDDYYYHPAQLLLHHVGDWDFNVFHLDTLSGGRSLLYLAYHIFREYGFIQRFRIDTIKLLRFFTLVEDNYHESNPYHNVIHATDVTQAMYCYLQEEKLRSSVTKFEAMMAIVSALAHDLDHPGVNQTFLVATANHLAALYQNTSVLEMHHWRYGVGLMQESGLFSHFSSTQWATALWQFRSLILATDITRQQEFLLKFRRMIDEKEFDYESNLQSRHFVLQIALKCADICNPCRYWAISEKWSRQVCEEFFSQGDMERQVGVPVTPVCDRHANTVAKIQIGFMEVVARPLFMEWKRFLPTDLSQKMLDNILKNKANWQVISEKEQAAKALASKTGAGTSDASHNNATIIVASIDQAHDEEEEVDTMGEKEEEYEEEEEEVCSGEEADTVRNDVNLAFHYQTDSEQMSEGSNPLPPVSEEEQLMMYQCKSRRRHSMPVVVRKDLAFYMGLRRDSFTRSNFQRRQSLPANPVTNPLSLLQRVGALLEDQGQKLLSVEGMMARPKISSLSSTLDTRLDYLQFCPLSSQINLMQHGDTSVSPNQPSSSCLELRRRSTVQREEADRRVKPGVPTCQKPLVGLASSWPSILHAGHKVDPQHLQLLATHAGLVPPGEGDLDPNANIPDNSLNNNSVPVPSCLTSAQTEGVSLLSRPH